MVKRPLKEKIFYKIRELKGGNIINSYIFDIFSLNLTQNECKREDSCRELCLNWSKMVSDGNYFLGERKIDLGRLKIIFNPWYIYIIKVSF